MDTEQEPSLKAQASKLAALLESAADAIITIDSRGIIESANPAAERLFQYERKDFIGSNVRFLMPEPYRSEHDGYIERHLETGERRIIGIGREVAGRRRDGTTFPMHLAVSRYEVGGETFFTGIIHDLSSRKHAERVLQQAQKMEAIGQLTGGIAHDFNNLLSVIIGNLELLEVRLPVDDRLDLLREAQDAADLGARLTERLLAFGRRSILEPEIVDLNELVVGLTDILRRTLEERIDLSTVLSNELWATKSDPSQIESAIINLAVNARDAMPDGGRLIIETRNAEFSEFDLPEEAGLTPGQYVQLSVTDTGAGMAESVRERVFEPFFTTKQAGHGTGLGLPMVYGFASQSGGHLTIYSEEGKGTTVNIYLPRNDGEGRTDRAEPSAFDKHSARGERILVVEDDERVRLLTVRRLKALGYDVLEAADGPEALAILSDDAAVDLVFSDLVMPGGISGDELCRRIQDLHPGIKALLTSGYAEERVRGDMAAGEQIRVLRKPYRTTELAEILRETLTGD